VEGVREAVRALGGAGLVAVSTCGHWWTYPFAMTFEQMHDVARFNRVTPCPFCVAARQARANAQARPPSRRMN
jgi:hypothetical protein